MHLPNLKSLLSRFFVNAQSNSRLELSSDISEVMKSQPNRRRLRRLQIFQENSIFKAWKINIKYWIYVIDKLQVVAVIKNKLRAQRGVYVL